MYLMNQYSPCTIVKESIRIRVLLTLILTYLLKKSMIDKKKKEKDLKGTIAGRFMSGLKQVKDTAIDVMEDRLGQTSSEKKHHNTISELTKNAKSNYEKTKN